MLLYEIYGRLTDVVSFTAHATAATWKDGWSRDHDRTLNTSTVTLGVSSASTSDAAAGTGARTLRVYGLDGNYLPITEDFTLNGQTKVTGVKNFLRVNYAEVLTAGTGLTNAGAIYIYDSTSAVASGVPSDNAKIMGMLDQGLSVMRIGMFTVPGNMKRTKLRAVVGDCVHTNTTAQYWGMELKVIRNGVAHTIPIGGFGSNKILRYEFAGGLELAPRDEVILRAASSASSALFRGGFIIEYG